MAAACCLVLSVPATLGLSSPHPAARVVSAAAVTLELLLVLAAAFFWLREEPQKIDYEIGR